VTNRVRLALGVLVSIVCTVLVLRGLDWREAARTIASVDLGVLLLATLVLTSGLAFKALRWRVLFRPRRDVSFWRLLDAINIGFLANNVLPARVGELVRPFVVSETGGPPYAWGLSTVVVERAMDVVTVVVVALVVIAFLPVPGWLAATAIVFGLVSVVGLTVLVLAAGSERTVTNFARRALRHTPLPVDTWTERVAGVVRGFAPLRAPGTMLVVALWTLPTWAAPFVTFHLLLRGVGLDLPFLAAVFAVCVIGLGVAAPSSPGQVGLFEGAGLVGLSAFTGDYERSVAAVLLFHALNYGVTSVAGLVSLARTGLTYGRIMSVVGARPQAPASGDGPTA
jgi:glycosyltransferase 2 family protein